MFAPQFLGYSTYPSTGVGKKIRHPVVLIRGLGRSSGFWMEFVEALRLHADVIAIDLSGTGKSPSRVGRGSIRAHARDLAVTLEQGKFLPCHLVGISLGGMVCLETAAGFAGSQRTGAGGVASLSVLASSARFTGERRIDPRALLPMVRSLGRRIPRNRDFARYLVSGETLVRRPDLPELWDAIWEREGFNRVAVVRQLLAAARFHGQAPLEGVECPLLFMVSRHDGLVDWRNTLRMWERRPRSRLHVLEGAGHDFPTERPEETARLLIDFFQDVEASKAR